MANENATNNVETTTTETHNNEPTIAELQAQLAQISAEKEQLKNSLSKSNSEAANYKKALREKQTAEEQEAEAKAEAERLAKEERESLKAELNQIKAENAYKGNVSEDSVQKLVDAVSNADHNAIAKIILEECEKAVAREKQIWLDGRPPVNSGGNYSPMTKEKIMAIKDATERQKAIAENIELFG